MFQYDPAEAGSGQWHIDRDNEGFQDKQISKCLNKHPVEKCQKHGL